MAIPFNLETAQKLREKGLLSEAHFSKVEKMHLDFSKAKKMAEGGLVEEEKKKATDYAAAARLSPGMTPGESPSAERYVDTQALNNANTMPGPPVPPQDPGSMQNVSFATTDELALPENETVYGAPQMPSFDMSAVTAPYDQIASGINDARKIGMEKAAAESAYLEQAQKEDQARVIKAQQDFEKEQQFVTGKIDELSKMKVDPDRYWANKSTGQKVAAGIGMFLGAFGGGNENQAVAVVQNAIKQDIDAQRADIDNQTNVYNKMYAQLKDKHAASAATNAMLLNNAQIGLKAMAAKFQGPELAARYKQMNGQLEAQKMKDIATVQGFLGQQYKMQQGPQANATLSMISTLPPEYKKSALEELRKVQEYDNFSNEVSKSYASIMGTGGGGLIPSFLGGDKESYKSTKAFLSGAIVGKVPGIKSDSDFENIVVPMLPKPGESLAEAEKKKKIFDKFLHSQAPAAPVLDGYGLRPKKARAELGLKEGFIKTAGKK